MSRAAEAPPSAGPGHCDLLLTGGCVLTVDDQRRVLEPGAVAVTGDRITAVGVPEDFRDWTADHLVDCTNRAIIPGFVDAHTHLFQALARGLGEGLPIVPWLCEFMWPYSIAITGEDAQTAARLGAVEAARSGVTCVIDNHYAPADQDTTLAVADVIDEVGLRGAVARGVVGPRSEVAARRGQPDGLFRYSAAEEIALTRDCMQSRPAGSRVGVWPAPLNLTYVEPDLVRECVELAVAHGTRWHAHCCEGAGDPVGYAESYGVRPVERLTNEGLLDTHATLAHAIWLNDEEITAIGQSGAGVAHNPTSNAYLASGTLRLRALRDAGAVVALGTDGPSCGHRQDLFECMKQAVFTQRQHTADPESLRCAEALELATREGARYAGIDAGVLEPGRLADIAVIRLDRPHLAPRHRTDSTLVYSAHPSDVDMTIVGGRVVVSDGRCVSAGEEEVAEQAQESAERLVRRAGLHSLRDPGTS